MRPVLYRTLAACLLILLGAANAEQKVGIAPGLYGVETLHNGEPVLIQRNQDTQNTIDPAFQKTSRKCPPFCIQPMHLSEGVETIGELQLLDYLKRVAEGDDSIRVIDSRGAHWLRKGTIPGSINIPFKKLSLRSSPEEEVAEILEDTFGAQRTREGQFWNFRPARTLVLFCNGMWCGQAPTNIRSLLRIGYPPSKLKWYRGGMQDWETLGFTKVTP